MICGVGDRTSACVDVSRRELVAGLRNHGVHDGAVSDASGTGKQVATLALDLLGGGFAPRKQVDGDAYAATAPAPIAVMTRGERSESGR